MSQVHNLQRRRVRCKPLEEEKLLAERTLEVYSTQSMFAHNVAPGHFPRIE